MDKQKQKNVLSKELLNTVEMIHDVAQHLNIHILGGGGGGGLARTRSC